MTPAGLKVRRQGDQWLGMVRVGAGSPDEARSIADGYMARHAIACEWAKTNPGRRVNVGVIDYRAFDVLYRLEGRP